MTIFEPPIDEMSFVLNKIVARQSFDKDLRDETVSEDLVAAVLEEAGKFARDRFAPLNASGDQTGARLENGVVRMSPGFAEAYQAFAEAGWNGAVFDEAIGGQGLPWSVQIALTELWNAANMSLALCPLLTQAAIDALSHYGDDELKSDYLGKLVAGEWTAAMCLTEPHAGTDVGSIRTKAEPDGDRYRIKGTKIYITYGDHDMTPNIVHFVLARLPDAPQGTKGISLFLVPKFLPNEQGLPGARNDMRCVSLEHKLGIKASPTCVMSYGEDQGATGYLVGEPNGGMKAMFTMMNNARIAVGVQGLGVAERAFQQARRYAHERVQGRIDGQPVAIVNYPDLRRRLLKMRAQVSAMRAMCYWAGSLLDAEAEYQDPVKNKKAVARTALMTPIVKAWCTDRAVEITSEALQIHGGMGFMEETGVAQHYRDTRILPIYEGTNAIQAIDLVTRKLRLAEGRIVHEVIDELMAQSGLKDSAELVAAADVLKTATDSMLACLEDHGANAAQAAAASYLELIGHVIAAIMLEKGKLAGSSEWADMAAFYRRQLLPPALALGVVIDNAILEQSHAA